MSINSLPTIDSVIPGRLTMKEKLLARVTEAMLFPKNQPHWVEASATQTKRGFNARVAGYLTVTEINIIRPELLLAGWILRDAKYRTGNTLLILEACGDWKASIQVPTPMEVVNVTKPAEHERFLLDIIGAMRDYNRRTVTHDIGTVVVEIDVSYSLTAPQVTLAKTQLAKSGWVLASIDRSVVSNTRVTLRSI